uniref:Mitochondrial adenine nucleotide transporter ADNT1 n=3 Tax=Setaria TaxID=4554 RepID=K3Z5X6_SETIT
MLHALTPPRSCIPARWSPSHQHSFDGPTRTNSLGLTRVHLNTHRLFCSSAPSRPSLHTHAPSLHTPPPSTAAAAAAAKTPARAEPVSATTSSPPSSSAARRAAGDPGGEGGARGAGAEMASEDVVGKSRGDTAVTTIVNLAEEAKLAREGVKGPGHQVLTICKSLVAGGVAGGVSRTAVAPLERLKILLQVQNPHSIKYNGTIQGLKYIWRTEGLRGLFKGNGTNCARIVPNSAVKFFSYEQASKGILWAYRQRTGDEDAQLSPLLRLGAGACAGIIAMSATYPMDMVRGRITVQTDKSPYQYRGMFHALGTVYREEGFRALYRGWLPSVIGVVPYVGLNFAVYESLKDWLLQTNPFGLANGNELHVVTRLGCGAVAGTIGQTVAYPLDVIRRRMQMVGWSHADSIVTGQGKEALQYNGMIDAFRKTVRHEGVGALYKGLVPNSVKVVPSIAIAFVTYEVVKDVLGVEMRISD